MGPGSEIMRLYLKSGKREREEEKRWVHAIRVVSRRDMMYSLVKSGLDLTTGNQTDIKHVFEVRIESATRLVRGTYLVRRALSSLDRLSA